MKAHLNPFAPDRVQRVLPFDPALAGTSWEDIESKWNTLGRSAAIIGRKGSGKSTFLKTFAKRLEQEHQVIQLFFRVNDQKMGERELEQLNQIRADKESIVLVDGEGHLSWKERTRLRQLSKNAAGYLVARHHRSTLPTLLSLQTNPQLAALLLSKMGLQEEEAIQKKLPHLLRKKSGNLREVWMSLYDEYACKR